MPTWREVSARAGRNDLPAILAANWSMLSEEDLREAITRAWTAAEWPEQHIEAAGWAMLFDHVGFIDDGGAGDRDALPEFVTLYRGATEDRRRGMSWTDDRKVAEWFAGRFKGTTLDDGTATVWTITIPADFILARFHESGRRESEYVVAVGELDDCEWEKA